MTEMRKLKKMSNIILVDGPDGTGKTGYAQWLSEETGFKFLRLEPDHAFGRLDGETIEHMSSVFNYTLTQLVEQDVDLVIDRGPVSSIVYSRLFDRDSPTHAWDALLELDPHIIYLRCEPEELSIRYEDEKFTDVASIARMYDTVMEELRDADFDVVTVETSCGAPDNIRSMVNHWLYE